MELQTGSMLLVEGLHGATNRRPSLARNRHHLLPAQPSMSRLSVCAVLGSNTADYNDYKSQQGETDEIHMDMNKPVVGCVL